MNSDGSSSHRVFPLPRLGADGHSASLPAGGRAGFVLKPLLLFVLRRRVAKGGITSEAIESVMGYSGFVDIPTSPERRGRLDLPVRVFGVAPEGEVNEPAISLVLDLSQFHVRTGPSRS